MSHIFDPKQFKKLESPERKKVLPPELILSLLKLNPTDTVADVGCGIGYFSFPFAEHVNSVKAIDISEVMIDELKRRLINTTIQPLLGDYCVLLEDNSLDVFFTATVIHEVDHLDVFTADAIKKLKFGGRLIYLDFQKKEMAMGPPIHKRIDQTEVESLFERFGLSCIISYNINDVFYMVEGKK